MATVQTRVPKLITFLFTLIFNFLILLQPPIVVTAAAAAAAPHNLPSPTLVITVHHPNHQTTALSDNRQHHYTSIQAAIDSVPSGNTKPVEIIVEPGVYREKVVIPADKPYITLMGGGTETETETMITWDDSGDIFNSATVTVLASHFVGRYLTFQNTYGEGAQAVALRVASDKAEFDWCKIISYQDTLLDETGRHVYRDCYIEGGTDFIFGNGNSLFQNCHVNSISEYEGAITAQKRESLWEDTGFYFLKCRITGKEGFTLGRPWGVYSRVVYAHSYLSRRVLERGWDDWGQPDRRRTVYYGEYRCYGPGAKRINRVDWSRNLTSLEASVFFNPDIIAGDGWIRA